MTTVLSPAEQDARAAEDAQTSRSDVADKPAGQPAPVSPADSVQSWRLLRKPRFLAYFTGSLVSNMGTWLQGTAQTLLAYQLTHSALGVGLVTASQFAGYMFVGP